MILISKCIFDSIAEKPFEGYILTEGEIIRKVARGVPTPQELMEAETVIDCREKTVMAGFCDNHVHVFLGALDLDTCNVNNTISEEDAAARIYEFYKDRNDPWIIAFGWCHYNWKGGRLPVKETLDRYFADRPVIAVNDELHALWVNSKALALCGIDENTKDPAYGTIERGADGRPTGYILEQSAMMMFTQKAFAFSRVREKELILKFMERSHEKGVTAVGDMEIIGILKAEAYGELEQEGQLSLRIFFSPSIRKETDELIAMRKRFHSNCLSLLGAKGFVDGTPLGHTGLLVEEYSDMPGYCGEPVLDLEWLKERVEILNAWDIPVRLHACGDGAVRAALDDIELAQSKTGKALRNTIEHIENIHPEDLRRFAQTGTIASIQPYHMSMDSLEEHPIFEILGEERCRLAWPAKSLMKQGAKVALGTDCPIVTLEPMQTIYCAVNRVMEDESPAGGWNPEEKLTLAEALKGCTVEVAYLLGKEKKIGTLQEGKLADIIVLSQNIFAMDELKLRDGIVEKTIFNGEIVFDRNQSE